MPDYAHMFASDQIICLAHINSSIQSLKFRLEYMDKSRKMYLNQLQHVTGPATFFSNLQQQGNLAGLSNGVMIPVKTAIVKLHNELLKFNIAT